MKLIPRAAAGRTNRRARAFSGEIARLHKEGYGYVAIQEALADVGVMVSKSTVQREVTRIAQIGRPPDEGQSRDVLPARTQTYLSSKPLPDDGIRSGKDIAEAFIKGQITNSLFRNRS